MKIIDIKINNNKNPNYSKNENFKGKTKYFAPSHIEWSNSIYLFNKNNVKSIPVLDNVILKFISIYTNMYNLDAEKKVKLYRFTRRQRWLSSRKVWIAKPELKHTNDKVIINLYMYDRINNIILMKLKHNIKKYFINKIYNLTNKNIVKKDILDNNKFNASSGKMQNNVFKLAIEHFKNKSLQLNNKLAENSQNTPKNEILDNSLKLLYNNMKVKFSKKILKQEMKILYYKKFLILNTLKYKNTFINILQKYVGRVYNKKIVFNIISLKNYYLNNNIFTKIIAHKSKDRNNKSNMIFSRALSISTPLFRRNIINRSIKNKYDQNIILKYNNKSFIDNSLNSILKDYYKTDFYSLEHNTLNKLKNKLVIGIRLELAGRLTKRFTAQRAVKRIKYVGTLKNIDSSFKGISTQVLRNNISDSIQYDKSKSQNRIGSFGVKGWINSI